jgi:hypothetical protein
MSAFEQLTQAESETLQALQTRLETAVAQLEMFSRTTLVNPAAQHAQLRAEVKEIYRELRRGKFTYEQERPFLKIIQLHWPDLRG